LDNTANKLFDKHHDFTDEERERILFFEEDKNLKIMGDIRRFYETLSLDGWALISSDLIFFTTKNDKNYFLEEYNKRELTFVL